MKGTFGMMVLPLLLKIAQNSFHREGSPPQELLRSSSTISGSEPHAFLDLVILIPQDVVYDTAPDWSCT